MLSVREVISSFCLFRGATCNSGYQIIKYFSQRYMCIDYINLKWGYINLKWGYMGQLPSDFGSKSKFKVT